VVAGFSPGEQAQMLVIKEAAVRQRLSRARKAFQRLYAQECGEHIPTGERVTRERVRASRSRGQFGYRSAALAPAAL
jgi:hypothetical protein